jgi:Replication-relaxation
MTGNEKKRGLVVQPRDMKLLGELAVMRVVDREQAKIVAGFGSTTRANVRLLALTRVGLLRRFFLGSRKSLYALSEKGAQLADVPLRGPRRKADETLVADFFIEHQLAINNVYCALKFGAIPVVGVSFRRWLAFYEPITKNVRLIPDGYVELATQREALAAFLEVDLGHERGPVWKEKPKNYLQLALSGEFEQHFDLNRFRVLVLANSERRMHSLRKTVGAITQKIFWFATLEAVRDRGFFAPVWYRPTSEMPTQLIEEHL